MCVFEMVLKLECAFVIGLIISISQIVIFFVHLECDVKGWEQNVPRNVSYYVRNEISPMIPVDFCETQFILLIVVTSAPSNKNARQVIRDTWGKEKLVIGQEISLVFFMGKSLDSGLQDEIWTESQVHNDIIQENFIDSYNNLTLKSSFIMKVATEKCLKKGKFLLKIDDDMFLNVPNLMKLLILRNNSENLLLGRMMCSKNPIRNPLSKWYCPWYMYNNTFFPNFLSGTGYLMSMDVTKKIYEATIKTPVIHLEDVYITGVVAQNAGITPKFNEYFTMAAQDDDYCQLKDLITMHQFSPQRIRTTFQALNDPELLKKCSNYEPMFDATKWMKTTLFMPFSRSKRIKICQYLFIFIDSK